MDPLAGIIAELLAERKRLDVLLDEALEQYALFEESIRVRMTDAEPAEALALSAESARIEEMLGITDLVERIDRIRERVDLMRASQAAA